MLQLRNILIARDFSPSSNRALCYAIDLVRRTGSTLHLLYAQVLHADPFGPAAPDRSKPAADHVRERLCQDVDGTPLPAKYPKIDMRVGVERDVAAAPAILGYAADHDIDLIVMGTRGRRKAARMLLGSVAEEVVRCAGQPVLTVHKGGKDVRTFTPPPPIGRILVPVDFSYHAREALRQAHAVAQLYEAELDLLHVTEPHLHPAFYEEDLDATYDVIKERRAEEQLRTFYKESALTGQLDRVAHVTTGQAADQIIQFAEEQGSDLVVMSTHGRTGLKRFMMGSVAEKVVRHIAVPVLTVKAFGKSLVTPLTKESHETVK